jgi:hypothetical protein
MAATLRSTYPSRYGHFASVPMPDVDGTLAEIALNQLRADGISWSSRIRARHGRIEPTQGLVFVHPLAPVCCAPSLGWIQPALLELRSRRSLPTSQHNGLKPGDLEAIYRGNAERPPPRLKV